MTSTTTTTVLQETETETREDIPLKTGTKSNSNKWCNCNEDCLGGSKFINAAFATLTLVISLALLVQIYYGDYQVIPHGSVATDSLECSKIGTSILKKGGNSIDATIASTFCLAVVAPHLTGLDAEGQLLIYNHRTRQLPQFIDFSGENVVSESLPRLVLALAYVHQQFASLPWKELVRPSVDVARNGFLIPKMLVQALSKAQAEDLYGRLEAGQLLTLKTLGDTLESIADISEQDLYERITIKNRPLHSEALKSTFKSYDVYVPNTPTIGPFLLVNLQQIEKLNLTSNKQEDYVYDIANVTQLLYKDLKIEGKFHEGTSSNVAAIDLNDNYVSLVTGMYGWFGAGEMTSAGYVLDVRNKEKQCSRVPVIITDGSVICGRRILFGAADISIASQVVALLLIAGQNATESAEAPRFIIANETLGIEGSHFPLFSNDVLNGLARLAPKSYTVPEPYQSCNIVEKFQDELASHSDSRGGGIASRF